MIALVANTPPPAIIECRGRARVSSVQHRVWVALGRSCSGDRALPVKAGKLGLGVLTGQRGSSRSSCSVARSSATLVAQPLELGQLLEIQRVQIATDLGHQAWRHRPRCRGGGARCYATSRRLQSGRSMTSALLLLSPVRMAVSVSTLALSTAFSRSRSRSLLVTASPNRSRRGSSATLGGTSGRPDKL